MSRPVLYLLDYADLGGGETSFLAFIEQWLRAAPQARPVVVLPQTGPVSRELEKLGVETHPISFPLRLRRGPIPWFSLPAARRIAILRPSKTSSAIAGTSVPTRRPAT